MDDEKVVDSVWSCKHEGAHETQLNEKNALANPPHYVICPDCGTHWIVWKLRSQKLAKPVIVPMG